MTDQQGNVVVVCRVRPLNKKEIGMGTTCCLDFNPDGQKITLSMSEASTSAFG